MSAFSRTQTMVYLYGKWFSAYSKSSKRYKVDSGKYDPMRGVQ